MIHSEIDSLIYAVKELRFNVSSLSGKHSILSVTDLFQQCRSSYEVEDAFFYLVWDDFEGMKSLFLPYQWLYEPDDGYDVLFEFCDLTTLLDYLKQNKLSAYGENVLVKRNRGIELLAYIENHYFEPEAEAAFVKNAVPDILELYLSKHTLSAEAQIALIKRGNIDDIEDYCLCNRAEEFLKKQSLL